MKRKMIVGGIGAVVFLILASLQPVIAINTINADIQSINSEKNTFELLNNFSGNILDYPPGYYLRVLFQMFISLIVWFQMNFLR